MRDAYRILGVEPAAGEAEIRAAYLTLMKRYHPDQPGADEERAKEIAAAYRLLGDPGRRAGYDRELAEKRLMTIGAHGLSPPPPRPRQTGRTSFFALSLVAAGLLALLVSRPPSLPIVTEPPKAEKLAEASLPDLVLPERSESEEAEVAPPRREASEEDAEVGEPAEMRNATFAAHRSREAAPARPTVAPVPQAAQPAKIVQPAADPLTAAAPTIDLAALDRHQTILYNQSYLAGDENRRARLMETRTAFLKRLEGCGSDLCRRDAYLARNQEVAAIMTR